MVDRIGGGGLAREAVRAALEEHARAAREVRALVGESSAAAAPAGTPGAAASDFSARLADGLAVVDAQVRGAEGLPADVAAGRIEDFHEIAVRIKQADLTFKFAMEVRNKLIDAYREVMRMSV
jgi:flagellar hook-basal body complex protein FliE